MKDYLLASAMTFVVGFISESIKNPNSPRAEALKLRLIDLRNQLNLLIEMRWPEAK